MSGSTGLTNGQSFKLQSTMCAERTSLNSDGSRDKHARCQKAGREDSELAKVTAKLSPQLPSSLEVVTVDVISDQELISLYEERIPRSSVKYDDVLRKAVFLLREKTRVEEEISGLRARNESLQQLNKTIREKSVRLHAKAEQEEEFISNMLLKRIQKLKNDKEALALKYEQEEEFLTNDLTRKLSQLQNERDELAGQVEAEQSWVVDTLLVKIRKLEAEISANHTALEQLRREKVDLENALEHEQESLFNTLGKRMDQLEAEKRRMQARLDQASLSEDHSPSSLANEFPSHEMNDTGERRSTRAETEARKLREECSRQRSVIASLKGTISNLQQQMSAQETKYVADLLAIREKSAESRANNRRARMALETDLARCLETCRAFAASETARESDEDNCMAALLNRMSVPKSMTPTPTYPAETSPSAMAVPNTDVGLSPWHSERVSSGRSGSQGERMEEGSETADVDGDVNMDASFFISERLSPRNEDGERFNEESTKTSSACPGSISSVSNEDSNESAELANIGLGQFARPALPPTRSPIAKRD
ncbi:coiled-coil domain-containing protein 6 [Loa loa]|uniref:Coiled-coil domain-containing protein 6 n=1 Tax=Loa loa TaxID=7209 RepID=A0A1I7VVV5_LOALO|nr:coiled-coil domain-containing protein 6 [Loa loa]EJD76107.1 coiled-coil domain-containing protein 6 [Loa loa]